MAGDLEELHLVMESDSCSPGSDNDSDFVPSSDSDEDSTDADCVVSLFCPSTLPSICPSEEVKSAWRKDQTAFISYKPHVTTGESSRQQAPESQTSHDHSSVQEEMTTGTSAGERTVGNQTAPVTLTTLEEMTTEDSSGQQAAESPTASGILTQTCLFVHISSSTSQKRKWDKSNSCYFCGRLSTNVTKHILSVHKKETEVQNIISKPLKSGQRLMLLEKLRNHGNYNHNCRVLKAGQGELIPVRSPTEAVLPSEYVPCEFCLGFFLKKELWRHSRECRFSSTCTKKRGRKVISRSQMLLPAVSSCSEGLKSNIFSCMASDSITFIATHDPLIVSFGERLYQKYGHQKHKRAYIKQKIRELARFLMAVRKETAEVSNMESCIDPTKFLTVISAVRNLCGYFSLKNTYSNPSLALKLGHTLKRCASIVRNEALMKGNEHGRKAAEEFSALCETDWSSFVSSAALATLENKKQNRPHVLPLTEDVKLVTLYLKEERKKCLRELKSAPNAATWHALAKLSLANVILFNKRRSGEAARMLVKDYETAKTNSVPQDDVMNSLSDLEKKLVDSLVRVEIEGKRGRKVPILLTADMCSEIEGLLETRCQAGICISNPFIFSRPFFSSEDHIAGHDCLREAARRSGCKRPEMITSTKLRKHIATVSQILNLTDHELDQVCTFMGHDVRVHRAFYRLPDDTLQLAKVSRLLIAMEQGKISSFKGQLLDNIQVDIEVSESDDVEDEETEINRAFSQPTEPAIVSDMQISRLTEPATYQKKRKTRERFAVPHAVKATTIVDLANSKVKTRDFLSYDQIQAVKEHFRQHILDNKVPGKGDCESVLKKEPLLSGKTWIKIKCTVRNEIEKKKRQVKQLQKQ